MNHELDSDLDALQYHLVWIVKQLQAPRKPDDEAALVDLFIRIRKVFEEDVCYHYSSAKTEVDGVPFTRK